MPYRWAVGAMNRQRPTALARLTAFGLYPLSMMGK